MALDFPSSPTVNDTLTDSGRTWRWDGEKWALLTTAVTTTYPGDVTLIMGVY